jgi:perosamine synthetase
VRETFLPLAKPTISEDEITAVTEVAKSGWWTTGPKVAEFENAFSKYLSEGETLHTVGLNSCTSALHLALLALGIGEGDEVIVPTWTFAATAQVVEWVGATVVLCDVELETFNIDVKKAKMLINEKTKAIIPVHIAGYPCDMEAIEKLAKTFHLKVIEDAAHAIGTKYSGCKIGNFSDITCFSFYATKNLAMGEGGAAVTRDKEVADEIRKLSYFGIDKSAFTRYEKRGTWFYDIEKMGYKCNLDSFHAALGLVQLQKLDEMNRRRREIANRYREELSNRLIFLQDNSEHYHIYHLFPIQLPEGYDRDTFMDALKQKNIGTSLHFRPLHEHSFYSSRFPKCNFQVANTIYKRVLSIPLFPAMSDEDVLDVIDAVNTLLEDK